MSKAKLEKDYQNFTIEIEKLVQQEIKNIQEKADSIKEEADKTGQAVELSLNRKESRNAKKEKG
jgi:hypothetical protein